MIFLLKKEENLFVMFQKYLFGSMPNDGEFFIEDEKRRTNKKEP